jgi:hypothetical protein
VRLMLSAVIDAAHGVEPEPWPSVEPTR